MNENPGRLVLPSQTRHLEVAKEGAIGWLIFNKPVRMNAISLDMWQAMPEICAGFEADQEIRAIIVTGTGKKAFISGADTPAQDDHQLETGQESEFASATEQAFAAFGSLTKPTIAMIQGVCMGGGLSIASACDLRYAGDGSSFSIPAARMGLAYPPDAIQRLINLIGPANAKELFYTARTYTAGEMHAMGFLNRIHPSGDLEIYVRDTCKAIAQNAPLPVRTAKISIDSLSDLPGETLARELRRLVSTCVDSDDYAEGRLAYREGRRPAFQGR